MFFNYGPGALLGNDTRLYDPAVDPGQNGPLKNSAQEPRLEAVMTRLMAAEKARRRRLLCRSNLKPPSRRAALRRRIEVPIGGSEIRIRDSLENRDGGETSQRMALRSHSPSVQIRRHTVKSGTIFARMRLCSASSRAPARNRRCGADHATSSNRQYELSVSFNSGR
jgi:hypothetical protein